MDFRADGAWRVRTDRVRAYRRELFRSGDLNSLNRNAGRAQSPSLLRVATAAAPNVLTGTVYVPVIPIAYSNVPVPFPVTAFQDVLFTPTPATLNRAYSLKTYYEELSNHLISLEGDVFDPVRMDTTSSYFEDGCNGIGVVNSCPNGGRRFGGMLLAALDSISNRPGGDTVWAQFDNDGPDGLPNSGDDDGVVDFVTFLHPTVDGACGTQGVWSHRFQVRFWNNGSRYVTKTPRKGVDGLPIPGQFIQVDDYTIQSELGGNTGCLSGEIMPIGTIAHETGHAFGLPDLYDTDQSSRTEGIGEFGLMGSGNFARSYSPASYDAWSMVELGWVTVKELAGSTMVETGARQVSDTVFLAKTPVGAEYFLIENRQSLQSDTAQMNPNYAKRKSPGLLLWFIDEARIASGRPGNRVNSGPAQGVSLMQADGLNQLRSPGSKNRGDEGDSYPGTAGNTRFAYSTNPASRNNFGEFAGFMIDQIEQLPSQAMRFRFTRRGLSVFRPSEFDAVISVNGTVLPRYEEVVPPGDQIALSSPESQLSNSSRTQLRFLSWSNGGSREQVLVSGANPDTVTANYDAAHRLRVFGSPTGGVTASVEGDLAAGFFLPAGTPVTLTAAQIPGMVFVGWQTDTVATGNVLTLPMKRPYDVTAVYLAEQVIPVQDATDDLLGTAKLNFDQRNFLDQLGNRNGGYDVGDYLALLDRSGVSPSPELLKRIAAARPKQGGKPK
ncbi:MAG TPA: M6 family metalloprotease domain-containing protein [Gemmatimonadales bacterium]|nr:M6 family metalloprotease domain-containing protein [Gemmatimonadales bacterium]